MAGRPISVNNTNKVVLILPDPPQKGESHLNKFTAIEMHFFIDRKQVKWTRAFFSVSVKMCGCDKLTSHASLEESGGVSRASLVILFQS